MVMVAAVEVVVEAELAPAAVPHNKIPLFIDVHTYASINKLYNYHVCAGDTRSWTKCLKAERPGILGDAPRSRAWQ